MSVTLSDKGAMFAKAALAEHKRSLKFGLRALRRLNPDEASDRENDIIFIDNVIADIEAQLTPPSTATTNPDG